MNGVVSAPGSPATSHRPNTRWHARWPMVAQSGHRSGVGWIASCSSVSVATTSRSCRCSGATSGRRADRELGHGANDTVGSPGTCQEWPSSARTARSARDGRARGGQPVAVELRRSGRAASPVGSVTLAVRRPDLRRQRSGRRGDRPVRRERGECGPEAHLGSPSAHPSTRAQAPPRRRVLAQDPRMRRRGRRGWPGDARDVVDRPASGSGRGVEPRRRDAIVSRRAAARVVRRISMISSTGRTGSPCPCQQGWWAILDSNQ